MENNMTTVVEEDPRTTFRPMLEPRARVLVVEDDDAMRAWVEEILRDEGYEVLAVSDSLGALISLMRDGADVLVTDWKMPDFDGLQLLAAVRRCNPALPVVFVTAYADEPFLRRVMEGGAFSCLAKPFPRRHLLAHVQGALVCSRLPPRGGFEA
jgi:DNA-binding response OmpR family regulator